MNYVIVFVMCILAFYGALLLKAWRGGEQFTKKEAIQDAGRFFSALGMVMGGLGLMVLVILAVAKLFGIK